MPLPLDPIRAAAIVLGAEKRRDKSQKDRTKGKREKPADKAPTNYHPDPRPERVVDKAAVEKAFAALSVFDWGTDYEAIVAIDDAAVASYGDAATRKDLESRLAAVLSTNASQPAKGFACRMLSLLGTADCVPALAELLGDKDLSHLARSALQRIGGPESAVALRDALPKASEALKPGIIGSLAALRDDASVGALTVLAREGDKTTAFAAINALGKIGTVDAARALADLLPGLPDGLKLTAADASLACAEQLLVDGKKTDALQVYRGLSGESQPKRIRLAATRGLLAAAQAR